jgi:O-antigen/teichoic acid export membrane protein
VSVGARVAGVLAQVLSVRLAIHHLGLERYGVWLTLSSLTALLGFADLGLGNGILNTVAAADGREDTRSANMYVSSAFFMLASLAALVLLIFGATYAFVPWSSLFNLHTPVAMAQTAAACAAFALCFALNLPLSVAQRVQMAYQKGYITNAWQAIGSMFSLLGVWAAVHFNAGLPALVLAFMGGPLASQGLNTLHAFALTFRHVRPRLIHASRAAISALLKTGLAFLAIQVLITTSLTSDNIIIARVLGAGAVASYGMVWQLFTTASSFIMMFLMSFWPAYGEAQARGDTPWIRHALKTTCALAFALSLAAGGILLAFGRQLISLWVGSQFRPPIALLAASAISCVVVASTHPLGIYLMATGRLRFNLILGAALLPATLITKVLLLKLIGTPGLPLGTALPYLFIVSLPTLLYTARVTRQTSNSRDACAQNDLCAFK